MSFFVDLQDVPEKAGGATLGDITHVEVEITHNGDDEVFSVPSLPACSARHTLYAALLRFQAARRACLCFVRIHPRVFPISRAGTCAGHQMRMHAHPVGSHLVPAD